MMVKHTQLSANFKLEEFTYSEAAIKNKIDNTNPNEMQIMRLGALCDNVLEPIRRAFNSPVRILSGWRCAELNTLLGGVPDSQHMRGEAADITIRGIPNVWLYNYISTHLSFDQVIAERLREKDGEAGWIHVSFAQTKRQERLSFLGDGKYVNGLVLL